MAAGADLVHRPVRELNYQEYLASRYALADFVCADGVESSAVCHATGHVGIGESLLLVTDGVTKVLEVLYDAESEKVLDNSGREDLARVLGDGRDSASGLARVLLDLIDERLTRGWQSYLWRPPNAVAFPQDDDVGLVVITR